MYRPIDARPLGLRASKMLATASLATLLSLVAGCERAPEEQASTQSQDLASEPASSAASSQDAPSSALTGNDDESVAKGARGAADVLSKYYELLKAGRLNEASQLWRPADLALASQSPEQSVADYQSHEVHIGEPGRIEGAAGSLYISIPVQIDTTRQSGEHVYFAGEATLRRSNDVPGATPEQRAWRIARIDLQPTAQD